MPASNTTMIHKLQTAINQNGGRLLYEKSQFFSEQQNRPVTIYRISQQVELAGKKKKEKLFDSTSQIQIVLYLRDYWYWLNGKEVPVGTEMWEEVKAQKGINWNKDQYAQEGD